VRTGTERRPSLGHVGALDGVRAVAVVAVVLYHGGVNVLHGGFLGVDVFFVLSGFLITSLLLTELEGSGKLRLGRFYERRARRLLPGLVVLVALVVFYVDVVEPHGSFPSLPTQVLGTMLYVGNWTLIAHHTSYFSQGLPPSPLEHTWSLAIEEQFYFLWPITLLVLRKLSSRRRSLASWCGLGAVVFSVITALQYEAHTNVDALYFSTQTHATTMLIGAAAACLLLRRPEATSATHFLTASARSRPAVVALSLLAWAGVVVTFFEIRGTSGFLYRGGYAVFGVLVAAAIGSSVAVLDGPAARFLSWQPVAFLGRISYGIYLYHFPLFIWMDAERLHVAGAALLVIRLAATLLVATVSYVAIEQPVRQRRFLRGRTGLALAVSGFTAVAVFGYSITSAAVGVSFADSRAKPDSAYTRPIGTTTTVLIVGDSMAGSLGGGLNNPITRSVHVFFATNGVPRCSFIGGVMRLKDFTVNSPERCDSSGYLGWPARWERSLRRWDPQLTMVLYRGDLFDHLLSGRWQHLGDPQFDCTLRGQLVRAAATLSSTGAPVVFLTTPYYDTGEQSNGDPWPEDEPWRAVAYNDMLAAVAAEFPDVIHVVDLNAMVSPQGHFTRTIGSTVVRWVDGIHFTYAGDAYLIPRLLPSVLRDAALRPTRGALSTLAAAADKVEHASCVAATSASP
jgi:peptidoglycan/LPS O-acetylase OafA/YrhL